MLLPVHFAFQGGGAKIALLIAVADAIYENQKSSSIRIAGISGTSAGAIAACMLASGVSPALFRNRILEVAPKYIDCFSQKSTILSIFKAIFGYHIYDRDKLKLFFEDIFQVDGRSIIRMRDLPLPVRIMATNISCKEPVIYDNQSSEDVSTILMRSASIPFVFHCYKDTDTIVDGGIVSNLPIDALVDEASAPAPITNVIAISFKENRSPRPISSLKSYALALISTSIDSHVTKSARRIPNGNLYYIATITDTFDFQRALTHDLDEIIYNAEKEKFIIFFNKFCNERRLSYATLDPKAIAGRLSQYQSAISTAGECGLVKVVCEWTSHSLKNNNEFTIDELNIEMVFVALTDNVMSIGTQYRSGGGFIDIGDVRPTVFDHKKNAIAFSLFPLPPELLGGNETGNNLILLFHRALTKGSEYTIRYKTRARELLFELSKNNEDWISYVLQNFEYIEELVLIAHIPGDLDPIRLCPLSESAPPSEAARWKRGNELSSEEIGRNFASPLGFRTVGWRTTDLKKGGATGFKAMPIRDTKPSAGQGARSKGDE